MPAHWTYGEFKPESDLAQGDIIEPTPELQAALREFHKGFVDDKYVAFMVLTQSCDLVHRSGAKPQPISLCVVRELGSIVGTLLQLFCGSDIPGVFLNESKYKGKQFVERAINQNEDKIGLFYLHPDADSGVVTPCVAMLRIAFALHMKHYDVMRAARRGRLRPEFQAKLGWLVGNLYSRVGTTDWSESTQRKKDQEGIIEQAFQNLTGVRWASSEAVRYAKKAGFSAGGKTLEEIGVAIDSHEPQPLDEQLQTELKRIIADPGLGIAPAAQELLLKRIPGDLRMDGLFRRMRKLPPVQ